MSIIHVFDAIRSKDLNFLKDVLNDENLHNINKLSDDDGVMCVHVAAGLDEKTILEYLLKHGANVDCVTLDGLTPLHISAIWGRSDNFSILLDYGANLYLKDNDGYDAQMYAIKSIEEGSGMCVDLIANYLASHSNTNDPTESSSVLDKSSEAFVTACSSPELNETPNVDLDLGRLSGSPWITPRRRRQRQEDKLARKDNSTYNKEFSQLFLTEEVIAVGATASTSNKCYLSSLDQDEKLITCQESDKNNPNLEFYDEFLTLDLSGNSIQSDTTTFSYSTITCLEAQTRYLSENEISTTQEKEEEQRHCIKEGKGKSDIHDGGGCNDDDNNTKTMSNVTFVVRSASCQNLAQNPTNFFVPFQNNPTNSIPIPTNSIPIPSNSIPISTNSIPISTNSIPIPSNSIPISTNSIPIPTNSIPIPTNSIPIPTNSIPIPTNSIPIPTTKTPTPLPTPSTTIIYDWKDCSMIDSDDQTESIRVPNSYQLLTAQEVKKKIVAHGQTPGPITQHTKQLYLKKLWRLEHGIGSKNTKKHSTLNRYPPELRMILTGRSIIPNCSCVEEEMMKEFSLKKTQWRGGKEKSSFNYLLLDPRVSCNLPSRSKDLSETEAFRCFVLSVFYIGKGKRSRPYAHLHEAIKNGKANKKLAQIWDIWDAGLGVISLHIFQSAIPVEAFTREAHMVEALGLSQLTNQKRGEFYGLCSSLPLRQKRNLGIYFINKALQIFLQEGERPICKDDL